MKTTGKLIFGSLLWLTVNLNGFSQAINTLSIIPLNPTAEDTVKVIANVWLPSGDCWLQQAGVSVVGQDINVIAGYDAGMLTVICTSIDTVPLGRFSQGTYHCLFNMVYPYYTSAIDDSQLINFTVSGFSGIADRNDNFYLGLHRGDRNTGLIEYSIPKGFIGKELIMNDLLGRTIYTQTLSASAQGKINIPLSSDSGMFIITILTEQGRRFSRQICY